MTQKYLALGLMSGTSLDGIDVALIETDGVGSVSPKGGEAFPYDRMFRDRLRLCLGQQKGREDPQIAWAESELTKRHAQAVLVFMDRMGLKAADIHMIGFHGQTIWHAPKEKKTIQLGDGALLATLTGIDVVNDFRSADVLAGGQGAPLVPLYHQALAQGLPKPMAVVNVGGVSNMTYLGGKGETDILAFDMGPGNALLDDWMLEKTGKAFDKDGALSAQGRVDQSHLQTFLLHPYFERPAPKSLDRDAFTNFVPSSLSDEDGAATLTMMMALSISDALRALSAQPVAVYVAGGGRHNATMMRWIAEYSGLSIQNADDLGWNGDFLEAEAFAYLAVRSVLGLPLSLPTTTGVPLPMTGGRLHKVKA
ncbi:MAG: anhydro-N-acetylmuramic acid kinase [Alphaproteobacteria bacterium]|nr:anhydro-N-acetylmuramic acid kinase [Alphaproteobacteria bacterium]